MTVYSQPFISLIAYVQPSGPMDGRTIFIFFLQTKTGKMSTQTLLHTAVSAALEAGRIILDIYDTAFTVQLPEYREKSGPLTIVGSRSYSTSELQKYIHEKEQEMGTVQLVSAGSSLKFCLVAEGQADIYPRLGPTMEWDTAAGQAVSLAAGRSVRIWDTKDPLIYNKEDLHNPWFVVE
jgi:3'-phosphoadenosine 5'-phosphosulfate (PAPS) 3'-phosphatase